MNAEDEALRCRMLWVGVLTRAVQDITFMHPELRGHSEAYAWLFSNETMPRSFLWVCEQLGIEDIRGFRAKILKMKRCKTLSLSMRYKLVDHPYKKVKDLRHAKHKIYRRSR